MKNITVNISSKDVSCIRIIGFPSWYDLNNMKEEYKSILILKYDMELSYKEIALLLGTNEDVIKTYMYRARNKFKEEWRMINEQV